MDSPFGPTQTNIFMCYNQKRWLDNWPHLFKPIIYRRYVDDTFHTFLRSQDVDLFLGLLELMTYQH